MSTSAANYGIQVSLLAQISELLAENIVFNSPILARPTEKDTR
jgi:hypothetical protein